ncbi:MAG: ParB/RepB/Spo0J family partition protein [Pseudomonadota bacterium]
MSDSLCEIDVNDIDLTDERYKISLLQENVAALALSIQETGLICPPMVRRVVRPINNKYIVIFGFNRIRALIFNNTKRIQVLLADPELSDRQCLIRSIAWLSFQRLLSQSELIRSVQLLSAYLTAQEIFEYSLVLFKQKLNIQYIEQILAISKLPEPAMALIESNQLSLKAAQKILSFNSTDIKTFLSIFEQIKASNSKQLEIILHLKEIAARDKINIKMACQQMELNLILTDNNLEPNVKTQQLRNCLFNHRFPTLSKARDLAKQKISSLNLSPNIAITFSETFERQEYMISFTAKNFNEFKTNVLMLEKQIHHDGIKEIFDQ